MTHLQLGTPVVWVWDILSVHLMQQLHDFAEENKYWLLIFQLPSYAPDLNPQEWLWSLKRRAMVNFVTADLTGLVRIMDRKLKKIQYRPDLVDGCLAGTAPRRNRTDHRTRTDGTAHPHEFSLSSAHPGRLGCRLQLLRARRWPARCTGPAVAHLIRDQYPRRYRTCSDSPPPGSKPPPLLRSKTSAAPARSTPGTTRSGRSSSSTRFAAASTTPEHTRADAFSAGGMGQFVGSGV